MVIHQTRNVDQAALDHGLDIADVPGVTAFDFGQCLTVEIVMEKVELAVSGYEDAALLPSWKLRDEMIRRRQLDVDIKLVFEERNGFKKASRFGRGFEINIKGGGAPVIEQCTGTPVR